MQIFSEQIDYCFVMSVKDRLLEFIRYLDIPILVFEKNCSMSNGYVSSIRKGLGHKKLQEVLNRYPQLNKEWLLEGKGKMLNDSVVSQVDNNNNDLQRIVLLEEKIQMLTTIIEQKDKLLEQKDKIIEQLLNK